MPASVDLSAYDTDKSPEYLRRYEQAFGHMFDQEMKLLELGVLRGGSMYLWRDLLPYAQVVGLDLNHIDITDDSGRIHVFQGHQQDPATLDRIASEIAPDGFDVIIDDASHLGKYTKESFWYLFPRYLKPGGVYVLDDWGCGYWPEWPDGHTYTGSRTDLGDFSDAASAAVSQIGRVERARRSVRKTARPIAARLSPAVRARLNRTYMRAERMTVDTQFPSHEYGMPGFVKQLVDAVALPDIDRASGSVDNHIDAVRVCASQVFVHKKSDVA